MRNTFPLSDESDVFISRFYFAAEKRVWRSLDFELGKQKSRSPASKKLPAHARRKKNKQQAATMMMISFPVNRDSLLCHLLAVLTKCAVFCLLFLRRRIRTAKKASSLHLEFVIVSLGMKMQGAMTFLPLGHMIIS